MDGISRTVSLEVIVSGARTLGFWGSGVQKREDHTAFAIFRITQQLRIPAPQNPSTPESRTYSSSFQSTVVGRFDLAKSVDSISCGE